ncbi:MAG: acyl-CoA dehydrogenase family protein [Acidimicrobiales bacterium]
MDGGHDGADELEEFRHSLARWLDEHLTPEVVAAGHEGYDHGDNLAILRDWSRALSEGGWAAVSWPARFGGRGADVAHQLAFHEEMARAGAPGPVNVIGVSNIAPAIMQYGTPQQAARFLTPMLRGDEIWCQGMSEPDAGSDLASLSTSAVVDGETFVVNGQKTWNSLGRFADWCQLYVRTDPTARKHKGISCLLVDMTLPGIEVRPVRTMAGDLTFAELFFDNVAVPADALLGPLNEGWRVAMATLSHERAGVAKLHLGLSRRFEEMLDDARQRSALRDPVVRERIASLYAQIACMRWTTARDLEALGRGATPSPAAGSGTKLMWARIDQELADLAVTLMGLDGLGGRWARNLTSARQASIAGGTTEINRNIVAEHGLGLPREPSRS